MKNTKNHKSKKGPGRPRKAAIPRAASPPPVAASATDLLAAELERVKARSAAGHRLANHEARTLRTAWLLEQSRHLWPNADAAAADLGVSVSTVRGYADQGCPDIHPHDPIPKAPVLMWLLRRAHEAGGSEHATAASIEAVELSIKRAKESRLWGTLVAEAEDRATQGVIESQSQLRSVLLGQLPGQLAAAARSATDADDAARQILDLIEQTIRNHPYAPPTAASAQEPTA